MAVNFRRLFEGLRIIPKTASTVSVQGEMDITSGNGKVNYHNGTTSSPVVTEAHTATLTNKTLSGNIATNLISGSGTLTLNTTGVITVPNATDTIVGKTTIDTLTNKTLTTPTIADFTNAVHTHANAAGGGQIPLATAVTGILPLSNGGTNNNFAGSAGSVMYASATQILANTAGTTSNWLLSGATAAPTFSNTTTTAKMIDGSADAIQLRVQANATQTTSTMTIENSSANVLWDFDTSTSTETIKRGAAAPVTEFYRANTSISAPSIVASSDILGRIQAYGYDGSTFQIAGEIAFGVDATPGAGDMPGNILLRVSPDGSAAVATAVAIGNDKTATFSGNIAATGTTNTFTNGVKFAAAGTGATTMSYYEEATYSPTIVGYASPPAVTVTFRRVGKKVTLTVPPFTGTSNATTLTLSLPTQLQPGAIGTAQEFVVRGASDVGVASRPSLVTIANSGTTLDLRLNLAAGAFTATGTKASDGFVITYNIA